MLRIKLMHLVCTCIVITLLASCAGGSRGTGVRFNRGLDQTDLNDDPDDDDDEKKNVPWHRS